MIFAQLSRLHSLEADGIFLVTGNTSSNWLHPVQVIARKKWLVMTETMDWVFFNTSLKRPVIMHHLSDVKCKLIVGNHLSIGDWLWLWISVHSGLSSTCFTRLSLVELLLTCRKENRIMHKIFTLVYVETSESFSLETFPHLTHLQPISKL